jgi:hypothetical protein
VDRRRHATAVAARLSFKGEFSPQLAVQLKKAGTSKQAQKTYKIATEGVKAVEAMLRGDS